MLSLNLPLHLYLHFLLNLLQFLFLLSPLHLLPNYDLVKPPCDHLLILGLLLPFLFVPLLVEALPLSLQQLAFLQGPDLFRLPPLVVILDLVAQESPVLQTQLLSFLGVVSPHVQTYGVGVLAL